MMTSIILRLEKSIPREETDAMVPYHYDAFIKLMIAREQQAAAR